MHGQHTGQGNSGGDSVAILTFSLWRRWWDDGAHKPWLHQRKGFKDKDDAAKLVKSELMRYPSLSSRPTPSFDVSIWETDHQRSPLANLKTFCQSCNVYCAAVIIPGVNDGPELEKTCNDLEEMGARPYPHEVYQHKDQGLILIPAHHAWDNSPYHRGVPGYGY